MLLFLILYHSPLCYWNFHTGNEIQSQYRHLASAETAFDPLTEVCRIGTDSNGLNTFGTCDPAIHFPVCKSDEFYCYNRINRHDKFYPDKNPYYYIEPRRVYCYSNSWLTEAKGACSSCSPGRFCASESRCILDEFVYNCSRWF